MESWYFLSEALGAVGEGIPFLSSTTEFLKRITFHILNFVSLVPSMLVTPFYLEVKNKFMTWRMFFCTESSWNEAKREIHWSAQLANILRTYSQFLWISRFLSSHGISFSLYFWPSFLIQLPPPFFGPQPFTRVWLTISSEPCVNFCTEPYRAEILEPPSRSAFLTAYMLSDAFLP